MDPEIKKKLTQILRDLESIRDKLIERHDGTPQSQVFAKQANIFVSTYFFTFTGLIDVDVTDLQKTYSAYIKSRLEATRYLFELYLTFAHFVSIAPNERFARAYTFLLSGKLDIHRLDLKNCELAALRGMSPEATNYKLEINRNGYRLMLQEWGKLSDKMPDEIDLFFEGTEIKNNAKAIFGINLFRHSKIDYTGEIRNNVHIPDAGNIRDIFRVSYPLLSLDAHPTPASLIDFEIFIRKTFEQKQVMVKGRDDAAIAWLSLIGEQFLLLSESLLAEEVA